MGVGVQLHDSAALCLRKNAGSCRKGCWVWSKALQDHLEKIKVPNPNKVRTPYLPARSGSVFQ
jgi:hypothetical protein